MSLNPTQLLILLYKVCPALNYGPLVQRFHGLNDQLRQSIDKKLNDHRISATEAELDIALFPFFVAFFLPPASATAIYHVLPQLDRCLKDLITLHPPLQPIKDQLNTSFDRFQEDIISLSVREPLGLVGRPAKSWPHSHYALYRFHVDCHTEEAYRPLATMLTLRLQLFWAVLDGKYDAAEKRGCQIEGLHAAAIARRGRMARQLVKACNGHLLPLTLEGPIKTFAPSHFEEADHCFALYDLIRPLFLLGRYLAKGHLLTTGATPITTPPGAKKTSAPSGPSPAPIARPSVTVHVRPHPIAIDCTAIPDSEFEEPFIENPAPDPSLHTDPMVRSFLNYQRQIKETQAAIPWLYDIDIIQMHEYAELIQRLPLTFPLHETSKRDLLFSLVTLTVMFYGQKAKTVLQTLTPEYDPVPPRFCETDNQVQLVYSRMHDILSYTFPSKWLGYSGDLNHPFLAACVPTTRLISLPLYPPFTDLYHEWFRRSFVRINRDCEHLELTSLFVLAELAAEPDQLVKSINAWLHTLEPSHYHGRWTLSRLANSWYTQATQRYGMDPLIALYVSGQQQWSVRSPSQYTAFPAARLNRELRVLLTDWWATLNPYFTHPHNEGGLNATKMD